MPPCRAGAWRKGCIRTQLGTPLAPDRDMTVRQGPARGKVGRECPTFSCNGKASAIAARLPERLGRAEKRHRPPGLADLLQLLAKFPFARSWGNRSQNGILQGVERLLARRSPEISNPGNYRRKSPEPVPSGRALPAVMLRFLLPCSPWDFECIPSGRVPVLFICSRRTDFSQSLQPAGSLLGSRRFSPSPGGRNPASVVNSLPVPSDSRSQVDLYPWGGFCSNPAPMKRHVLLLALVVLLLDAVAASAQVAAGPQIPPPPPAPDAASTGPALPSTAAPQAGQPTLQPGPQSPQPVPPPAMPYYAAPPQPLWQPYPPTPPPAP